MKHRILKTAMNLFLLINLFLLAAWTFLILSLTNVTLPALFINERVQDALLDYGPEVIFNHDKQKMSDEFKLNGTTFYYSNNGYGTFYMNYGLYCEIMIDPQHTNPKDISWCDNIYFANYGIQISHSITSFIISAIVGWVICSAIIMLTMGPLSGTRSDITFTLFLLAVIAFVTLFFSVKLYPVDYDENYKAVFDKARGDIDLINRYKASTHTELTALNPKAANESEPSRLPVYPQPPDNNRILFNKGEWFNGKYMRINVDLYDYIFWQENATLESMQKINPNMHFTPLGNGFYLGRYDSLIKAEKNMVITYRIYIYSLWIILFLIVCRSLLYYSRSVRDMFIRSYNFNSK